MLLALRARPHAALRFRALLHAADMAWAAAITLLTEGAGSPFFVFFVFVLLGAAYRWGLRETLATGLIGAGLLLVEAAVAARSPASAPQLQLNFLIMRSAYLLLLAVLLGYLAQQEKELRRDASALARIMAMIRLDQGLGLTLQNVLTELLSLVDARRALLVVREAASGRMYLWERAAAADGPDAGSAISVKEVDAAAARTYFLELPHDGHVWHAVRPASRSAAPAIQIVAIDASGARTTGAAAVRDALGDADAWQSLVGVSAAAGDEFEARLYLVDPARPPALGRLRLLQTIVRQTGPALYNLYLVRRLRSRIGAVERARVARELHDGVIQSLIGLEMELEAARRGAPDAPRLQADLAQMQQIVKQEVLNVRDLMRQLRPADVTPGRLVEYLIDLVERFHQHTGIDARFLSDLTDVVLPPRLTRELAKGPRYAALFHYGRS